VHQVAPRRLSSSRDAPLIDQLRTCRTPPARDYSLRMTDEPDRTARAAAVRWLHKGVKDGLSLGSVVPPPASRAGAGVAHQWQEVVALAPPVQRSVVIALVRSSWATADCAELGLAMHVLATRANAGVLRSPLPPRGGGGPPGPEGDGSGSPLPQPLPRGEGGRERPAFATRARSLQQRRISPRGLASSQWLHLHGRFVFSPNTIVPGNFGLVVCCPASLVLAWAGRRIEPLEELAPLADRGPMTGWRMGG